MPPGTGLFFGRLTACAGMARPSARKNSAARAMPYLRVINADSVTHARVVGKRASLHARLPARLFETPCHRRQAGSCRMAGNQPRQLAWASQKATLAA